MAGKDEIIQGEACDGADLAADHLSVLASGCRGTGDGASGGCAGRNREMLRIIAAAGSQAAGIQAAGRRTSGRGKGPKRTTTKSESEKAAGSQAAGSQAAQKPLGEVEQAQVDSMTRMAAAICRNDKDELQAEVQRLTTNLQAIKDSYLSAAQR